MASFITNVAGNGKINNTEIKHFWNTSNITDQPDQGNKGSDNADTSGSDNQENKNKDISSNRSTSNQSAREADGRRDCTLSEIQRSASPNSNPLHLDSNESSSEPTAGNGSAEEEDQDKQLDPPCSFPQPDNTSESSSRDDPGNSPELEDDSVATFVDQDQQGNNPCSFPQPGNANKGSLQDNPGNSSALEEGSVALGVDRDQRINNPCILPGQVYANSEGSLQEELDGEPGRCFAPEEDNSLPPHVDHPPTLPHSVQDNAIDGSSLQDEPHNGSDLGEPPPIVNQNQQLGPPYSFPQRGNANESSLQDNPGNSSALEEDSIPLRVDHDKHISLPGQVYVNSEGSLQEEPEPGSRFAPEEEYFLARHVDHLPILPHSVQDNAIDGSSLQDEPRNGSDFEEYPAPSFVDQNQQPDPHSFPQPGNANNKNALEDDPSDSSKLGGISVPLCVDHEWQGIEQQMTGTTCDSADIYL